MAHRKDIYSGLSMAAFQRHVLVYFILGMPPEISVHSEPGGKEHMGGPSCGRPAEGNSQTVLGHHTVNLLVQTMREKLQMHRPTRKQMQTTYASSPVLYGGDVLTWIFKVSH